MELQHALSQALEAHKQAILTFSQDLVRVASENPPGERYRECVDRIGLELGRLGLAHDVIATPGDPERPRYNVLGFHGSGPRTLYFHGHYDVAPAQQREQFAPRVRQRLHRCRTHRTRSRLCLRRYLPKRSSASSGA